MHDYDLIADWYAAERIDRTGVPEVLALSNAIPPGAFGVDVGCGNGFHSCARCCPKGIVSLGWIPRARCSAGCIATSL